jgi:response regulator RpfG family c-di-GMP phosphodiesterase
MSPEGTAKTMTDRVSDDPVQFADEIPGKPGTDEHRWKLLMVDDDPEVHRVTRLVLADFSFQGWPLQFLSAYSIKEALFMMQIHPETALVLLDVVMETDDAGLRVARDIREKLNNKLVRIVLRTGQPGKAPENRVILQYEINDYKEKTELTAQRLFTTVTAALREFQDLKTIEKNRRDLDRIIAASRNLFEYRSLKSFCKGVLTQLFSLVEGATDAFLAEVTGAQAPFPRLSVLAAAGAYANLLQDPQLLPEPISSELQAAVVRKQSRHFPRAYIGYLSTNKGREVLLYVQTGQLLGAVEKNLIDIFAGNVALAFDNLHVGQEAVDTQNEVLFLLGEVLESRSRETAHHVKRVAALAGLLAEKAGLDPRESELLQRAIHMHDVGKIAIPDSILKKPEPLSPEEYEMMKSHTVIGHDILKTSHRELMQAAAIVALQHHERWDGMGYPQGLRAEEIHLYARISGLADVLDAFSHSRSYKEAWSMDRFVDMIKKERGKHFDPRLVDLFLAHVDEFDAIKRAFER